MITKEVILIKKDLGAGCIVVDQNTNTIQIDTKIDNKMFTFDWVAVEAIPQHEVYKKIGETNLNNFFEGYNCTIFAYGQTGAGKTHTMLGPLDSIFDDTELSKEKQGLIPRILGGIFNKIKEEETKSTIHTEDGDAVKLKNFQVKCSCMEIYQEQIIDLLTINHDNTLVIREDHKRGMFVDGLAENIVQNQYEALEMILTGLKNRHVAATNMNAESSRSHLIFTIFLKSSITNPSNGMVTDRYSRLHLIDLAGSERQKATKAVGERIKEAGMINK